MAKLLVIDDQEFDYLKLFVELGYNVTKWDDVKDLQRLETSEYHVVLLDLKGIGRELTANEGAGIIAHIRETNPAQMIIAYTSARHNFAVQNFIDKADYRIPKSEDFTVFKQRVDECLERRFSEDFYLTRMGEVLTSAGYPANIRRKAEKAIRKRNTDILRGPLIKSGVDAHTVDRVLTVCGLAIKTAALIASVV